MEELLSQGKLHDPELTQVTQRVWDRTTVLLENTINFYQHQLSLTARAQLEVAVACFGAPRAKRLCYEGGRRILIYFDAAGRKFTNRKFGSAP